MSTEIGSPAWIEKVTKAALDNRANQLNPKHPAYWSSRSEYVSLPELNFKPAAVAIGIAIGAAAVGGVLAIRKLLKNVKGDLFGCEQPETEDIGEAEFYQDDEEEEEEEEE